MSFFDTIVQPLKEVGEIYNRMPNPLTQAEKVAITKFVDASIKSGNWDKYDYFYGFFLNDADNALTDWKTGLTATAVNAPTHTANEGYLGNGSTQYINSNINLSTDSTNYLSNDAHMGAYCYENLDAGANKMLFGNFIASGSYLYQQPSVSALRYLINSNALVLHLYGVGLFNDSTRYELARVSTSQKLYENGIEIDTSTSGGLSLLNADVFILARNLSGSLSLPINARVSYFFTGGGFDLTALNLELTQLESDLII